jgi:HEAT repeat protein
MKLTRLIALFALIYQFASAQTPSAEAMTASALQLLGTSTEQEAAVTNLIQIGIPAVPYVANFLSDKDVSVKNAAWLVVNGIGFEAVVSFYITQLSSDDAALRLQATKVLGQAAQKHFGYTADNADTVKRAAIVAKWTAWLADYRARNPSP